MGIDRFFPNFDISPDGGPGSCKITLPIAALNTDMTMETSLDTSKGNITIKNEFDGALYVKVNYYPDYNVQIQPGQCKVRNVLVHSILAYLTSSSSATLCRYNTPNYPPTFHSTFVITGTAGGGCEINIPTGF